MYYFDRDDNSNNGSNPFDGGDARLGDLIDMEMACFDLVPWINTYYDLEFFCRSRGINRSSWLTIYQGLMTLIHFGEGFLELTNTEDEDSIIIETLINIALLE